MYSVLHDLLSDQTGGVIFRCFGIWHILYLTVIVCLIALCILRLSRKDQKTRQKAADKAVGLAFGLYVLDFFLMPFAYGEIDIEKLPFHACTAMCILCFLSRRTPFLMGFKDQFALLGLLSNLVYLIYPAGVGWYQIHPLSYRVVQTMLFHGSMTAYGLFALILGDVRLSWKNWWKDLLVLAGMAAWALLGNTLYNGAAGDYDHFFNWFFVVRDPFYLLPAQIAPYVMPFVVVIVFFAAEMIVCGIYHLVKKLLHRDSAQEEA